MQTFIRNMLLLLAAPALALAATQTPPAQGAPGHVPPPDAPAGVIVMQPLQDIKGVVSWNTLAKVKQVKSKDRILPEFSKDIAALNDKEVKLQGFMMPLEPGEKQKHFLLSLNSQTCAYCMPAGPEGVVEVKSKTAIKYTFEPIIVSGKMSVLKNDPMGLYYRLSEATPASEK
jgi:hypothetical protein